MQICTEDQVHDESVSLTRTDVAECRKICNGDPGCVAMWHHPKTKVCNLIGPRVSRGWTMCKRAVLASDRDSVRLKMLIALCVFCLLHARRR